MLRQGQGNVKLMSWQCQGKAKTRSCIIETHPNFVTNYAPILPPSDTCPPMKYFLLFLPADNIAKNPRGEEDK